MALRTLLNGIFRRSRMETEIDDEMRFHLQVRTDDLIRSGVGPDEARRRAAMEFGAVENYKEQVREANGWRLFDEFRADLRYSFRMLRKAPGFSAAVAVSLALGLGANITIFSFVNALLLRPPSVEAPERMVELWHHNIKATGIQSYAPLSYPDYLYYRDHNGVLDGLIAFDGDGTTVAWTGAGRAEMVRGQLVSDNYFSVLKVDIGNGRGFRAEDTFAIVLSHAFWQQRLGSDPNVIGRTVTLNGNKFTILGVAPSSFTGILIGMAPDFWAPIATAEQLTRNRGLLTSRDSWWLITAGRLKDGIAPQQAAAALRVISAGLQKLAPAGDGQMQAATFPVQFVPEPFRGYVAAFTGILMAVVGMVLLIACVNVANLFLARMTSRQREFAIRVALGAGRGRITLQMLTETTLLSLIGGGLGLYLAYLSVPALLALKPASIPLRLDVPIDWRVIVFSTVVALATGLVFGLVPAARAVRKDVALGLKSDIAGGGRRTSRLRSALVTGQLAVCLVLLTGAGLCVRSLMNAHSIDTGFDTRHVIVAELDPGKLGYSESQGRTYYEQLISRIEHIPGVMAVSLSSHLPLGTANRSQGVAIDGQKQAADGKDLSVNTMVVAPRYFDAMGIPILRGRDFTAGDQRLSPQPIIINEAMARRFWPDVDPLGRRFRLGGEKHAVEVQIAGVVKTGKYRTLGERPQPFMYTLADYQSRATLVVRTAVDPSSILPSVRREMQSLDPDVVPVNLETMRQHMNLPLFPARATALLLGTFGALALVLAATGLFGVVSYVVSQRTREIGIRAALGANQGDIVRLIVRQALSLTLIGSAIGIALALVASRALSSLLYGVGANDVLTFTTVSLGLGAIALIASGIPALRAARIDPAQTLRYD